MGIRHVIRPTIGISFKPDLAGRFYRTVQVGDSLFRRLSVFEGSSFGPFSEGRFGGLSFGLDNNLEIKLRSKTDTSESGIKKVKLIDGFGFNGSYNYLADSFKLSPISIYLRSTLGSINITGGATLNPYVTDTAGNAKNIYAWNNPGHKFSLGSITTGNLAISTRFQSKPKDAKKAEAMMMPLLDAPPHLRRDERARVAELSDQPADDALAAAVATGPRRRRK